MIRGIDCGFYRNSAALGAGYAAPTWNIVDGIKDLDFTDVFDAFENTVRRGLGLKTYLPTLEDVEINFMLTIHDNTLNNSTVAVSAGNPDFDDFRAFQTAKRTRVPIDIMCLTGTTTTNGAEGFRMFVYIHEFSVSQANADGLMAKVKLKPAMPDPTTLATSANALASQYVRVTNGAPTYSGWNAESFS